MRRLVHAIVGLFAGYAIGVAAGALLVQLFSANTHDKSLEMAMTALLIAGPICAVLGFITGLAIKPRRRR